MQPCFSTQNWSYGNVKILLNTSCSVQGARLLPSDDSKSTMKKDCVSLCLNNCLLMHTWPTVGCGFYGWINRGMIEKARQDLETNFRSSDKSKWTIEAKLIWVTWGTRGERDVIRLRNTTEDKRAFRRMLTSADLAFMKYYSEIVPQASSIGGAKWLLPCLPAMTKLRSSFP